jgi:ectoine hydroxylase-related dioxygenase (phytanoyl-CoA dioxygenase family)
MMRSIFIRPEDTTAFARNGFVRKPLLDAQQVEALTALYMRHFPNGTDKFFSCTYLEDITLKETISKQLCEILVPAIAPYIENYKVLGAQYLVKNSGTGGEMPYHQDWTIVNETTDRSITTWIGLDDINESNGALRAIPGSHQFSRTLRGPGNFDALADVQQTLDAYAHTLTMRAGEAFIFDHSLMHGSGKNTTRQPRIAVALGLAHKDAPLTFYHRKELNVFDAYPVPDNFFITFPNNGQAPAGLMPVETIQQPFKKIVPAELISFMKEHTDIYPTASIPPLFKDPSLQAAFDKDGYVKIKLLSAEEAADLKAYYLSLQHDHIGEYGFHISLENTNAGYINGVFKKLFNAVLPRLDDVLDNYKAFTASYVIKEAGLQNIVPPHQDWTFVDEEQFSSATVWMPLMDVNKNNGALGVIKGSHRIFNYPRSSPSPQSKSLLSDHAFNLFPYVEVIDMKAGEALIFNNRTVHASPPNISGITRIAAGIGITQKDAQLLHYYQEPGAAENINVYAVDESFFLNYNNSKLSGLYANNEPLTGLHKINTFRKAAPALSKEEITHMVSAIEGVSHNTALMAELADLYNYNTDGTPKTKTTTAMSNNNPSENTQANTQPEKPNEQVSDTRTFFQKYTLPNIIAEIKYRLKKA